MRIYELRIDEWMNLAVNHDLPYRDLCFVLTSKELAGEGQIKELWEKIGSIRDFPVFLKELPDSYLKGRDFCFVRHKEKIPKMECVFVDRGDINDNELKILKEYAGEIIVDLRENF